MNQCHRPGVRLLPPSQPSPTRGEGTESLAAENLPPRFDSIRHCERSEAIQPTIQILDCFVASLLAMTRMQQHYRVATRPEGACESTASS
jgi:hypothetical protein